MRLNLDKTKEEIQKEVRKEEMGILWWIPNQAWRVIRILLTIFGAVGCLFIVGLWGYFLIQGERRIVMATIWIGIFTLVSLLFWFAKRQWGNKSN